MEVITKTELDVAHEVWADRFPIASNSSWLAFLEEIKMFGKDPLLWVRPASKYYITGPMWLDRLEAGL